MIEWDNGPAPQDAGIPLFRVRPGVSVVVRVLGPPQGVRLHWVACSGSFPCLGRECRHCPASCYRRGYVPALLYRRRADDGSWVKEPVVLEVPEACIGKLADGVGAVFEAVRGKSTRSALVIRKLDQQPQTAPPPAFDVRPILLRLWGIRESDQVFKLRVAQ